MEFVSAIFFFLAIIILVGIWSYARRGTFVGVCGLLMLLFSPVFATGLSATANYFDAWLWTFRLVGLCIFVWGLIENMAETFGPNRDNPR